ncbi:uncharacterized protein LOC134752335 [Cydia strobilella]|uniref:uncharacterized protein LOC134752335 n=1 Tax=Cydia strobilella TaxID=1100964 RepID=UPI0030045C3A
MESTNQCHCCLQRPSAKNLRAPYTRLGTTEIYSVMIEECFVIKLTSCDDGISGICEVCLGRLREASLFKMQVQHCQAKLQERLEGGLSVKDEEGLDELSADGAYSESPKPSLLCLCPRAPCSSSRWGAPRGSSSNISYCLYPRLCPRAPCSSSRWGAP